MIPTGLQIRKARQLAGLSQHDLATAAGVAPALIARVEASDGMPMLKMADTRAIQAALENAGISFISDENGNPDVIKRQA